jgi:hypothetical protein
VPAAVAYAVVVEWVIAEHEQLNCVFQLSFPSCTIHFWDSDHVVFNYIYFFERHFSSLLQESSSLLGGGGGSRYHSGKKFREKWVRRLADSWSYHHRLFSGRVKYMRCLPLGNRSILTIYVLDLLLTPKNQIHMPSIRALDRESSFLVCLQTCSNEGSCHSRKLYLPVNRVNQYILTLSSISAHLCGSFGRSSVIKWSMFGTEVNYG